MLSDLADRFLRLPAAGRKHVHHHLCAKALEAWRRFAAEAGPITYNDSVVGMFHVVDKQLPADAFTAAFGLSGDPAVNEIDQRYLEPIAAMQDWDLEFPGNIQLGYYAIYNAFRKYARHENMDDWLIVNQALSISEQKTEWPSMLEAAIGEADMKAKLQALASGQTFDDGTITYSDMHGLWGGVTITIGPGHRYKRAERQPGANAPDVVQGDLTTEQLAGIVQLLLAIRAWEQHTPERMPVPDESRATLALSCGGSYSAVGEWHNDLESNNRIARVRDLLMKLCR